MHNYNPLVTVNVTVCGYGKFPVEMLAKENCYPTSTDDGKAIAETSIKNDHWQINLYKIVHDKEILSGNDLKNKIELWQNSEWNKRGVYLIFNLPESKLEPEDFQGIPRKNKSPDWSDNNPYWWMDDGQAKAFQEKFLTQINTFGETFFSNAKKIFENLEKDFKNEKNK
jgi:hypothetical protein